MPQVYLDHAATTPLDPRVLEAMMPYLREHYGNPSSAHTLGRKARFVVEECRDRIGNRIGAEPSEIIFTSGGTESDNAAIGGVLGNARPHLITSAAEHEAVLRVAEARQAAGAPVTILEPQPYGAVRPEQVEEAITEATGLVSLMHANNELGTLTPIREIAAICHQRNVPLHCDAVQTAGLFNLNVDELEVDLLSISAHKFYGPKGIGVLYVRGGIDFRPLVAGGAQERRRRGGTENVAGIVGMAAALDLAVQESETRLEHLFRLQTRLHLQIQQALGDIFVLNTPLETDCADAAPHIINMAFSPVDGQALDGEMLLLNLDLAGVYASAGSACTSGALEPSHVLRAIGLDRATASAVVRFSLGKDNSESDVDYAVDALAKIVERMRGKKLIA